MKFLFSFFFLFVLLEQANALPLGAAQLKNCKNIAIISGTYDPFTLGHENMGREILKRLEFDCVVYLPTGNPPHKIASPLDSRYAMMEAHLKDEPKLFYPSPEDMKLGPKAYVDKLKTFNGEKRSVYAVLGSDLSPQNRMYWINRFRLDPDGYIVTGRGDEAIEVASAFKNRPTHVLEVNVSISSTDARKWFVANEQVYFKPGGVGDEFPQKVLKKEVAEYIAKNGLYYGSDGVTTRSPVRILKTAFNQGLTKAGLFEPLREVVVKQHKQDQLVDVIIDGKTYPLKKHLGSGLTADAYILNYDGEEWVVKIANQRPNSPKSILQDVKIGEYLRHKTSINIPEIKAVDPEGKYKISRLVRGESLGDYLASHKGVIEPALEVQLRKAVEDMLSLSKITNTKLDLSVDNLKIWNNKVYLIDAGPIPPDVSHPMSYEAFLAKWKKGAAGKVNFGNRCSGMWSTLRQLTF
jgi:nicotinic acid mononucleotide adenylyltransferase